MDPLNDINQGNNIIENNSNSNNLTLNTVRSFENFYKNNAQQLSFGLIKFHLDNVTSWLDREIIPSIYFILNDVKDYDEKNTEDCQIQVQKIIEKFQRLSQFLDLCKSRNSKEYYKFACSKCEESLPLPVNANDNFWAALQNHDHIEDALSNVDKLASKPEILEEIKKTTPEHTNKLDLSTQKLSTDSVQNGIDCKKCGSTYSPNFKFNFSISYNSTIRKSFYSINKSIPINNVDNIGIPTIQIRGPHLFACLLCAVEIPTKVTYKFVCQHTEGQRHLKRKLVQRNIDNISAYHENWMKVELNYQSHQSHFLPMSLTETFCVVCNRMVTYDSLEDHIITHKNMFLKKLKRNQFYLIDLQLAVYSKDTGISNSVATEPTQTSSQVKILENTDRKAFIANDLSRTRASTSQNQTNIGLQNNKDDKSKIIKHDIIKSILNPSGSELSHILEHRFLPHVQFFTILGGNLVECQCCSMKILRKATSIKEHILTEEHMKKANIPLIKYTFYCEICNDTTKEEKLWKYHLLQSNHEQRCKRLGLNRQDKVTEYHCLSCKMILFGDDLSIKRHQSVAYINMRRENVLLKHLRDLFKSEQYINEQSRKLVEDAKEVLLNQEQLTSCCLALENALKEVYGACTAHPFGSRISGLGNKDSDLDVFIDIGDMYMGLKNQEAQTQEKYVKTASTVFRKKKTEFNHVNPIPTARTPIVQVYHLPSGIDCDISFRHGLSVENTRFLRLCIEVQPIMQPLILMLKQWLVECTLKDNISTYALSMMVIFFLQVKNFLMPVQKLTQLYADHLLDIDGWKIPDFSIPPLISRLSVVPYEGSLKQLLTEFFSYYKNFNFETDVVCPLIGSPIKKSLFLDKPNGEALPSEMLQYVYKIKTNPKVDPFRCLSPLCIQDPFDLNHNLTKACGQHIVNKLKTMCNLSFTHLNSIH